MSKVDQDRRITWEGFSARDLANVCRVPRVELLAETDSTLDVAHALAANGAPSGTLVLADAQRAGRGRMGRSWVSQSGRGIWCTLIERQSDAPALEVLSIRVGLGVAFALDVFAGRRIGLKWPNDLMIEAGKLAGVLVEARWIGEVPAWIAIGIGVNVRAPDDVTGAAALGARIRRAEVLAAFIPMIREAAAATGHLTDRERNAYRERDVLAARDVVSPARGRVIGITRSGALAIETENGIEEHRTGSVRFAEES